MHGQADFEIGDQNMAGKPMVSARGKKAAAKRNVRHMTITPSKNGGAAIETHFHPTKKTGAADDAAAPYMAESPESEMHTTQTPEETGAHVASMLSTGYPPAGNDQDGDEAAPSQ